MWNEWKPRAVGGGRLSEGDMRIHRVRPRRPRRTAALIAVGLAVPLACSGDDGSDADTTSPVTSASPPVTTVDEQEREATAPPSTASAEPEAAPAGAVEIVDLLPSSTRRVAVIADPAALAGSTDPAFADLTDDMARIVQLVDPSTVDGPWWIGQTTDPALGTFALASTTESTFDASGGQVAMLADGVIVVGTSAAAVDEVVAAAERGDAADGGELGPYLALLDPDADLSFAVGLPALDGSVDADRSLRGAAAMTGTFDIDDGSIAGEIAFHTSNATQFVEAYNALDRNAQQADPPTATPLALAAPVAGDLEQVVVTIPPTPLDPTPEQLTESRNLWKKLFVGMDAYDYAEDVFDPGNAAWFNFLVKSELDDEPPSPGSVYIRWEFRDDAAREAFEQNELPDGFRLAPTRFLESDDPDGEYFLALNLYNGGGGMIVGGARAEWDVFVHGPDGADPNAGDRPRFFVVEALAEEVSADAGNLLTPAEPLSHELIDGVVVSSVERFDDDGVIVPVFESTFPVPDPDVNEVARFTREMAIGNDYIYWAHGVSDRVLYNATTFNHDAYFVDIDRLEYTDLSRWAEYLKPEAKDAVYYVNTLEYVASPMENLDSAYLDITPEWLAELYAFKNNGHQVGLMRKAVEQLFRGEADALVPYTIDSSGAPSTYYHVEITDPEGFAAAVGLPSGHEMIPIRLVEDGDEAHYLTLAVTEIADAPEGVRAEWMVYTDDGSGRPSTVVIELMTAEVAFDSASLIELPSLVEHGVDGDTITTTLGDDAIAFAATLDTASTTEAELTLDWIEAGDEVCTIVGVCDKVYYDAETLDVPVRVVSDVTVDEFETPWNEFLADEPSLVFFRDNTQLYVAKRWHDVRVVVEPLPFTGLDDATHAIDGSGSLVGRDSTVADSVYEYSGDAVVDGDQLTFAIDQRVDNALGVGNIYTTGSFDLTTGTGSQTVVDCQGPALLCSDITPGSTDFYSVQNLDTSDLAAITWTVDVVVDLGPFGTADSASTITATAVN